MNHEKITKKLDAVALGQGPTDDGRRKPDVAAPSNQQHAPNSGTDIWDVPVWSTGHTSLSVPHTAGAAALLLGLADDTTTEFEDGHSVVIKAVIVNSTFPNIDDRSGVSTKPADPNNTWHPDRGYGRIDSLRAYQLLSTTQIPQNTLITQQKGWAFSTLAQGQSNTYLIDVPKNYRIVATVTWHRWVDWDDEPVHQPWKQNGKIDPGELHPYLADLDMLISAPEGIGIVFSEALAGLSPLDNLEKTDFLAPVAGQYTITITNNSSSSGHNPDYGFAFELIAPIKGDFDLNYVVDELDFVEIVNSWLGNNPQLDTELFEDGDINLRDFAIFANNWQKFNPAYH